MTLPSTGSISLSQVNVELGRSATAPISLGESAVRALAGIPSGPISMNDLRGKSNVAFTPNGGASAGSPVALSNIVSDEPATLTISCTQSAVWNWTYSGSGEFPPSASVSNGGSGTTITFTLTRTNIGVSNYTFTVNATSGGVTKYWTVNLNVEITT